MTLDQLIEQLMLIRQTAPGSTPIITIDGVELRKRDIYLDTEDDGTHTLVIG